MPPRTVRLEGTTRNAKSGRGGLEAQAVGIFRAALLLRVAQVEVIVAVGGQRGA